jgi:hypothetical protein
LSASFSSTATASAFIPSGATVPTNGMYLSAANTLNFATNSGNRMTIGTTGSITMSSTLSLGNYLTLTTANTFIYGGTTVGSIQYGNSTSSTHLKTYGATHATLANVIQLTNNSVVSLTLAASGAATFGGTLGINGVANSVTSGTYSPTLTNIANVAASSITSNCIFQRVGNTVTVYGFIAIDPTTLSIDTSVDISLPIASAFTFSNQLFGNGVCAGVTGTSDRIVIYAETTNDRAQCYLIPVSTGGSQTYYFSFSYQIL